MPYTGETDSYEAPLRGGPASTTEQESAASNMLMPTSHEGNGILNLAGMAVGAAADLVDTAASSKLVSWATGAQRGDVNLAILGAIDAPGVTQFYNDHQKGIELFSGIGGLVGTELAVRKFAPEVKGAFSFIKSVPYLRRLATLDAEYTAAMATVRATDLSLARRGAVGLEQYAGETAIAGTRWDSRAQALINDNFTVARNSAVSRAKWLGAAQGAGHAALVEGISSAVLNQNSFLYTDDASQNLAWMALGVAGGGAFDWMHTAYQIRRYVNGDEVRRAFAGALDPHGVEAGQLHWMDRKANPLGQAEGFLGGSYTDMTTSMLTNASLLKETPASGPEARALLDNRNRLSTQHRVLADETMQKVTTKGITSDGTTRFSMDAPGYGNHVRMAMHRDAGSFYGVEMVGGVPDTKTSWMIHESHQTRIKDRIAEVEERLAEPKVVGQERLDLESLRRRLDFESTLTPQVMIDGERMPISESRAIEGFQEPVVKFTPHGSNPLRAKGTVSGLWESASLGAPNAVSIDSDLLIHIPSGKGLRDADHFDILRLYRAGQRAIEALAGSVHPIRIPDNPNWFQLDMAEEILRRSENTAPIIWPQGMTRDSAMVESFAQKAEDLAHWDRKIGAENMRRGAKGLDPESFLSRLRVRFNLPKLTAYERGVTGNTEHSVESLMRGAEQFGMNKLRAMSAGDLKEAVAAHKRVGDVAPVSAHDIESLSGNSFRYMLDESGKPIKPLLMYSRPVMQPQWTLDAIAERLAARKMSTIGTLAANDAGELSRLISGAIIESPDARKAMSTHELMDNQIQGSVLGSAPQTFLGSASKALQTSEWVSRDNPILLAATRTRDTVERIARDYMRKIITDTFGDSINLLANPRNAASKLLLNQFHSYRAGWDLAASPKIGADGFARFTLLDTAQNHSRWAQVNKGAAMPAGQTLLSPEGREVVLDQIGLDLQKRFNIVSESLRKEKNTLLRSLGMQQIDGVNWYTPPPNIKGKYIGMVMGPDGKPVPGMGVVASTPEEFAKSRAALTPKLDSMGLGYVFRTQDEIRNFASIWDRAHMDMISPSTTAVQPGKRGRGVLSSDKINLRAFDDSMTSMRDQFLAHANDVTEAIFKEQINSSKARSAMAAPETLNRAKLGSETRYRSIYDIYQENLLGRSKLNSTGSAIAPIYNAAEKGIDSFLAATTPTASRVWEATNAWINKIKPWDASAGAKKDFESLSKALDQHMPFASMAEMIERQGAGAKPWTAAKITNNLNQFTAGMLLRVAEVAHPIMNLAGIVNAMPAVIRNFTPQSGETAEQFATRVGHLATIFNLPSGQSIGVVDMAKIGARSLKRALQESSHADFKYMVDRGYLSQEVAEFHRQFGAVESKGSWERFFLGDHNAKGFQSKGVVGWLSILSDKSEDFSRSWGHMAGLELAESLGITERAAKHSFAHDIANKMIANYNPSNRPEIFQGALGSTLGLFQSFAQNYYQRMFRYVETKDFGSLMTQLGTQGAIFGVTSLPGWKEFNGLMSHESGGENDADFALRNKLGGPAADLIGHGLLSNLPKLFGAPGVDLYSRGDSSVRLPGTVQVPAVSVLTKIWDGINQGIAEFNSTQPGLSGTQLAEIASNMIANRPLAGQIEQFFAHGNDTDRYGQLVTDTRGAMEAAYRLIGLRSERQSEEINAYYANKTAMEHKAGADEILRLATRTAIRAGEMDKLPRIYEQYLTNGGDPRYFRRWLKESYQAATSTRGERQLRSALKDPNKMGQVIRLLDAGVTIGADEKTPDTTATYGAPNQGDELDQPEGTLGQYSDQLTIPTER